HFHDAADGHLPPHPHAPAPAHGDVRHAARFSGVKPFLVGVVHGLAGSAALTLVVLGGIGSVPLGLVYLLVFGAGSIGGMVVMSLALSVPFAATVARPMLHRSVRVAAGLLTVAFGLLHAILQIRS